MTTVVTKLNGAEAKPVGLLYIEPERQRPDAGAGTALVETGLDAISMADLLSACLAHERCGVHLYRSVAARTTLEDLRVQYEHFGEETLRHVELLEELIASSGGNPAYVSPAARATEKAGAGLVESTWAVSGSLDVHTAELAMLEAVALAEAKDLANWELLNLLADEMADGDVRKQLIDTVETVLPQELEHHGWATTARTRVLFSLATGGKEPPAQASPDGDGFDSVTKDELYDMARRLDIEGRSQMTKGELADAVSQARGGAA
jgi:rubrerythrin